MLVSLTNEHYRIILSKNTGARNLDRVHSQQRLRTLVKEVYPLCTLGKQVQLRLRYHLQRHFYCPGQEIVAEGALVAKAGTIFWIAEGSCVCKRNSEVFIRTVASVPAERSSIQVREGTTPLGGISSSRLDHKPGRTAGEADGTLERTHT